MRGQAASPGFTKKDGSAVRIPSLPVVGRKSLETFSQAFWGAMPPARTEGMKKGIDKDEARRGREETTISLRKEKRNEQLQKKRFGQVGMEAKPGVPVGLADPLTTHSVGSQAWLESDPQKLIEGVHGDDPNLQLAAVTQFRKLLSIERSPPIEEVIAAGVVPRFVQFLQVRSALSLAIIREPARQPAPLPLTIPAGGGDRVYRPHASQCGDNPMLQFESAWALTNIASGTSEHTRVVIANGAPARCTQPSRSLQGWSFAFCSRRGGVLGRATTLVAPGLAPLARVARKVRSRVGRPHLSDQHTR